MNEDDDLRRSLRALKEALPQQAGPAGEQQLLRLFRERRGRRRRRAYMIAAAAAVICGLFLFVGLTGREVKNLHTASGQMANFIELPYSQSGVPLEQPVIVRMDIPVSELGAVGVRGIAGGREKVRAEVLVGQDGVARAVRLVE